MPGRPSGALEHQKCIAHRPGALLGALKRQMVPHTTQAPHLGRLSASFVSLAEAAQQHTIPVSKGGFRCESFHPLLLGMQFGQEVNYMDTQFHQGNFNHWWKLHLNMGQSQFGQAVEQFDRLPQQQWQLQPSLSERMAKMDDTLQYLMQMSDSHHKSTQATFRRIGRQLCHISQKLDNLESNMKYNPREECQAIITRSDKVLDERKIERKEERLSEKERKISKKQEVTVVIIYLWILEEQVNCTYKG
ncbi:hypothetical protein LR48_Vigan10g197600 [Vigna angularis]|uniref:Uncharacterized protein n=1 Tax=Phaseolus angularis TaxID=3914 RepID=A0A0L9VMX7_PHAAN|nr:hypothetical protein LR48_Vigan10g197600 [Vigna angularis]